MENMNNDWVYTFTMSDEARIISCEECPLHNREENDCNHPTSWGKVIVCSDISRPDDCPLEERGYDGKNYYY